jgi:hypothetical protein
MRVVLAMRICIPDVVLARWVPRRIRIAVVPTLAEAEKARARETAPIMLDMMILFLGMVLMYGLEAYCVTLDEATLEFTSVLS